MSMIDEPVHVDISNVARWWYLETRDMDDAPAPIVVPPWKFFLMEYDIPTRLRRNNEIISSGVPPGVRASLKAVGYEASEFGVGNDIPKSLADNYGWVIRGWLYFNGERVYFIEVPVDASGGAVETRIGPKQKYRTEPEQNKAFFATVLHPFWFAVSLLHCKNVELVDKPISRQYRRMMERKGEPITQYKTLVIEPFKKQVRNEARESGQNEIERALHICRGHFRTYSEDKPLFGKISGTFWIPMHVRGNADVGTIEKDYKVVADSDTDSE